MKQTMNNFKKRQFLICNPPFVKSKKFRGKANFKKIRSIGQILALYSGLQVFSFSLKNAMVRSQASAAASL